jgi:two-component system sensor histidine kinase BaeS
VGSLTAAARTMEQGDLSGRVPVAGGDEIATLAGAFNAMADSLERQDRLRRTLTSDIAHELRTPLSNIRGYLEAIREGVAAATPEVIASIHEEAVHLQGLIDDLQELALAEAGELPIRPVATDLGALLQAVVQAHRGRAESAGITLTCEVADAVTAAVDAARVRQAVANLLDNALRHTPAGGTVIVGIRRDGPWALLSVADTGGGIEPEHLPHVFERLYRADPARSRETGGGGLGLAIARALVRSHGGEVVAESDWGRGATFTVRLPIEP